MFSPLHFLTVMFSRIWYHFDFCGINGKYCNATFWELYPESSVVQNNPNTYICYIDSLLSRLKMKKKSTHILRIFKKTDTK